MKKIPAILAALLVTFVIFVQSRPADFRYVRSGVIRAEPKQIFPYLSQFKLGNSWSPYAKKDRNMQFTLSGAAEGVGQIMDFAGSPEVGKGRLEVLEVVPDSAVTLKLTMLEPIHAENTVEYTLTPEGSGASRFTWAMSGKNGFVSKLMGVLIDCDKLVAGDFEVGIQSLKELVESQVAPR